MGEQAAVWVMPYIISLNDESLARQIYRALEEIRSMHLLGSPLHVRVSDGTVTLRGIVATRFIKAQILQAVHKVPGVQQVQDELWV